MLQPKRTLSMSFLLTKQSSIFILFVRMSAVIRSAKCSAASRGSPACSKLRVCNRAHDQMTVFANQVTTQAEPVFQKATISLPILVCSPAGQNSKPSCPRLLVCCCLHCCSDMLLAHQCKILSELVSARRQGQQADLLPVVVATSQLCKFKGNPCFDPSLRTGQRKQQSGGLSARVRQRKSFCLQSNNRIHKMQYMRPCHAGKGDVRTAVQLLA